MLGSLVTRRFRPALLLVLVVGFVVALQVTPAFAATITVGSLLDGTLVVLGGNGTCDLREAVAAANTDAAVDVCAAGTGIDVIDFSGAGTITLTAQLAIEDTDATTIDGGGDITISGNNIFRVLLLGNETINDTAARQLTLTSIVITLGRGLGPSGGAATPNGGCILVRPNSTLTVNGSSDIRNCRSTAFGGGIYGDEGATINLNGATEIFNSRGLRGGGVYVITGTLVVNEDSCIRNNSADETGGGIHVGDNVTVTLGGGSTSNRGYLIANTSQFGGGGIYIEQNSTFTGNHARIFGNTDAASGRGGWYAEGGAFSRSCINCCIVGNTDIAVGQLVNGNVAVWQNNWWGSDFGPFISMAGTGTASGTSFGDSASDFDPGALGVTENAIRFNFSSLPADYGDDSTGGGTGFWLRSVDNNIPSDCTTDLCGPVSGLPGNRATRLCVYSK